MKKNLMWRCMSPTIRKTLLVMKLSFILILVGSLQLSASVLLGQQVSVQAKTSLVDVLEDLNNQTGTYFMYNVNEIDDEIEVQLDMEDASLEEVLNEICQQAPVKYEIVEDFVIITKQDPVPVIEEVQEKKELKGRVTDKYGEPLPGVSVVIKGSTTGVATDINGNYTLELEDKNAVLIFSFVGMLPQERNYTGQMVLNVTLLSSTEGLDEVVVTGYFNKGKTGFAGAVSTFKQEDIQKISTGNMLTTLSVLDAGFRIQESNTQGSNPNAVPDFTIRGRGSFQNESTQPIFIVDGFQNTAEYVMDLDPNRIKSMSILKDAAATILYGSRAGNGVVVIETVAPKAGELRVTYDFRPNFSFPDLSDYNLMDAREKLEFEKLAGLYEGSDAEDQIEKNRLYNDKYKIIQEGVDTYWLSQPVQNSVSQSHSLYVEGGVDKVRYGIDASYRNNRGVIKDSGNDKFDLGFKLIYRIADKITIQNYASFS
ncbi:carboxypeptidase-like regulatory domain-containing protein [Marinifilum sp. D714]|uniref:carboxypeptidase-like regulatory domain-containing protein n=1 Tax=Marinifilum sp. D714 TaxID=2937523 RepID=UPI0027CD1E8D|nr:carboxypeptidase-like regulatory domain-containing protein [Marinifilum sp. D714]MDQ2177174.1 carboxypeptidase-like regulatory domain-containing protein [Marinifilum sp. D714]